MPIPHQTRRKLPPVVAAVVQPVARRLSRMEALLIEIRHEQDVQLKRAAVLQAKLDDLADQVADHSADIRKLSRRKP
jgi:predicted  nucleic acid-binding Zn-ribbon protein